MPQFWLNIIYLCFLSLLYVYSRSEGGRYPTFLFLTFLSVFFFELLAFWQAGKHVKAKFLIAGSIFEANTSLDFRIHVDFPSLSSRTLAGHIDIPRSWSAHGAPAFSLHPGPQQEDPTFHLQTGRRGKYTLGPVYAQISDPLGLFKKESCLHEGVEIWVTPTLLPDGAAYFQRDEQDSSKGDLNLSGWPSSSARPYQYGDPFQRIHWKSTARVQKIMVRETEAEESYPTLLWLDLSRSSYYRNEDALETAVSLTATLLKQLNQSGHSLRFISSGGDYWETHLPTTQFAEVQKHLAVAAADGEHSPEYTMARLPKINDLMIITASLSPQMVEGINRLLWDNQSVTLFLTDRLTAGKGLSGLNPLVKVRCAANA